MLPDAHLAPGPGQSPDETTPLSCVHHHRPCQSAGVARSCTKSPPLPAKPSAVSLPFSAALAALALLLAAATAAHAEVSVFPTGTTIYDPARAYGSFLCFSALDGNTHVVDMDGHEVHRWPFPGVPGEIIDPALVGGKRGHVLLQLSSGPDQRGGIFSNRTVGELDWDGATLWEWGSQAPGGAARQNHDWARLANGHTLLLVTIPHAVKGLSGKEVGDQAIYEVDQNGSIAWQWVAGDHLDEFGFSPEGIRYLQERIERNPIEIWGYLEINNLKVLGPNRWFDGGDQRFNPDNLLIDSRKGNVIAIIERTSGKIVWRLGPYFSGSEFVQDHRLYNRNVPRPVDQLSGQHDAHLIPKGLPGAGDLLVFDDQGGAGFPPAALGIYAGSRILEIDPVKKQIVWQYTGEDSGRPTWTFFSSFVSNARRLPNGNTLIDEGMYGRFFQVTPGGDIVWEYVNPYPGINIVNGKSVVNRLVYRVQPVPYDWLPAGTPHTQDAVVPVDQNGAPVPAKLP